MGLSNTYEPRVEGEAGWWDRFKEKEFDFDSPWSALMMAGLNMAAGESPNAITNIAGGGLKGIEDFRSRQIQLQDSASEQELRESQGVLNRARAKALGNKNPELLKQATDMAEAEMKDDVLGEDDQGYSERFQEAVDKYYEFLRNQAASIYLAAVQNRGPINDFRTGSQSSVPASNIIADPTGGRGMGKGGQRT